jgi:hypothetical protein
MYNEVDKTLFDFDDEIDKLSDVSERYKVAGFQLVQDNNNNESKDIETIVINDSIAVND